MNRLQLDSRLGEAVLDRLSQLVVLPETGLVAGQAVTSALFDLHDGSGGVYNDVDVFRATGVPNRSRKALATAQFTDATLKHAHDPQYAGLEAFMKYRVLRTARNGLLNTVFISNMGHRKLTPHAVLSTFDFNCVQVGVHLPTRRLVWTPAFERFCQTKQLELASVHTPWHSAIRLFKKLEELKSVWCDVESSMDLLSALAKHGSLWVPRNFGEKSAELYRRYETQLAPFFSLEAKDLSYYENGEEVAFRGYTLIAQQTASEEATRVTEFLREARWALAPQLFYASKRVVGKRGETRNQVLDTWIAQSRQTSRYSLANAFSFYRDVQGSAYLEAGQVSASNLNRIKKVLDEHDGMTSALLGYTFEQQLRIVQMLHKLAKQYGEFVWGLAETSISADSLLCEEEVVRYIQEHLEKLSEVLVKAPLQLPERVNGFTVRELKTGMDLHEEGCVMHHCVGGYANSVRQNICRIIQIRKGPIRAHWSTVEVRAAPGHILGPNAKLEVVQHRSVFNGTPCQAAQDIVEDILSQHGYTRWDTLDTWLGATTRCIQVANWATTWIERVEQGVKHLRWRVKETSRRLSKREELLVRRRSSVAVAERDLKLETDEEPAIPL